MDDPTLADLRCSFCNKDKKDVLKLVAGPTVFICDECVTVCNQIIADDALPKAQQERHHHQSLPPPWDPDAHWLDAQAEAARQEAKRLNLTRYSLCFGPTNVGRWKMLALRTFGRLIGVPSTISERTSQPFSCAWCYERGTERFKPYRTFARNQNAYALHVVGPNGVNSVDVFPDYLAVRRREHEQDRIWKAEGWTVKVDPMCE